MIRRAGHGAMSIIHHSSWGLVGYVCGLGLGIIGGEVNFHLHLYLHSRIKINVIVEEEEDAWEGSK